MRVQEAETECLSPQGSSPITPGLHPGTVRPASQDNIENSNSSVGCASLFSGDLKTSDSKARKIRSKAKTDHGMCIIS